MNSSLQFTVCKGYRPEARTQAEVNISHNHELKVDNYLIAASHQASSNTNPVALRFHGCLSVTRAQLSIRAKRILKD
jgi:hypothetical protein